MPRDQRRPPPTQLGKQRDFVRSTDRENDDKIVLARRAACGFASCVVMCADGRLLSLSHDRVPAFGRAGVSR